MFLKEPFRQQGLDCSQHREEDRWDEDEEMEIHEEILF
jgi:hypothetical protein